MRSRDTSGGSYHFGIVAGQGGVQPGAGVAPGAVGDRLYRRDVVEPVGDVGRAGADRILVIGDRGANVGPGARSGRPSPRVLIGTRLAGTRPGRVARRADGPPASVPGRWIS